MSRTINDIYQQMLAAKEADSRLSVLTSNSSAAVWKLLLYVAAASVWVVEERFDMFRAEITDLLESKKARHFEMVSPASAQLPAWG